VGEGEWWQAGDDTIGLRDPTQKVEKLDVSDTSIDQPLSALDDSFGSFSEETKVELEQALSAKSGIPLNSDEASHGYSGREASRLEVCPRCQGPTQRRITRIVLGRGKVVSMRLFQQAWFCSPCRVVVLDERALEAEAGLKPPFGDMLGIDLPRAKHKPFLAWNGDWFVLLTDDKRGQPDRVIFPGLGPKPIPNDDTIGPFDLSIVRDPRGIIALKDPRFADRTFSCIAKSCSNPCCHCSSVTWYCLPLTADSLDRPSDGRLLEVQLDLAAKRVEGISQGKATKSPSKVLARALQSELTNEDWNALRIYLRSQKALHFETCDLEAVYPDFPKDMLHDPSLIHMIHLFPGYAGIPFMVGDGRWIAHDGYCVNPTCPCTEANLMFFSIDSTAGSEPRTVIGYDLAKKHLERVLENTSSDPELPKRLLETLLTQTPDLDTMLEKNRLLLRRLYEKWVKKVSPWALPPRGMARTQSVSPVSPTVPTGLKPAGVESPALPSIPSPVLSPAVGRNDPCPCGSGKKYKKCCGG